MSRLAEVIDAIELHSVDGIRDCFAKGIDPNELCNNEPLIYELTSQYTRSTRFKDCVKVFVDHGLEMEDEALLAVLMDDAAQLKSLLKKDPGLLSKTYTLRCAYTPMQEISLLHICAEFNHVNCAAVLVDLGAEINIKAGVDEHGFGGQTPLYHTVNQNGNQSADMLHFLLSRKARVITTVAGLIWGKGYQWETFIPAVNPISYAMMGLLPQMHRDEKTIADTVSLLMKHAFGIDYIAKNVPNAYLK